MKKDEFNVYEFHLQITKMVMELSESHLQAKMEDIQRNLGSSFEEELKQKQELHAIEEKLSFLSIYQTFHETVYNIVDQFKQLLNCTIKDSFMKKKKSFSEIQVQKKSLTDQYILEINRYPTIASHLPSFSEEPIKPFTCKDCKVELDTFENSLICPQCCVEHPLLYQDETVSYKDLSRINTNVKYSYIRQTHFRDTIKQFQGKQNKYIDAHVYNTLYSCFDSAGMKLLPNGKYNVSKDHIKMFLQENSLYKYYEDINLIHYEITGIPCPDISAYEKELFEDFDKFVLTYDKVIHEDYQYNRSNILNSYYILFQLLKKNGYPCKESDFPIIKTVDRKIEHDEIYEKCCKQLGWFFFATV